MPYWHLCKLDLLCSSGWNVSMDYKGKWTEGKGDIGLHDLPLRKIPIFIAFVTKVAAIFILSLTLSLFILLAFASPISARTSAMMSCPECVRTPPTTCYHTPLILVSILPNSQSIAVIRFPMRVSCEAVIFGCHCSCSWNWRRVSTFDASSTILSCRICQGRRPASGAEPGSVEHRVVHVDKAITYAILDDGKV